MPDSHTPAQRSYNMSRIRSSGTKPERVLGELLRAMFPDSELIERPGNLPGRPDWYLPKHRIALFADGCFFHGCPRHFIMPLNNALYWKAKIAGNRDRDRRTIAELRNLGLVPVRIWEHELRKDVCTARQKIRRALRMSTAASSAYAPDDKQP